MFALLHAALPPPLRSLGERWSQSMKPVQEEPPGAHGTREHPVVPVPLPSQQAHQPGTDVMCYNEGNQGTWKQAICQDHLGRKRQL